MKRQVNWDKVKRIYQTLVDELSLKQYAKLIGGGTTSYWFLAHEAKVISKSKNVHYCANAIQYLITGESNHLDALQKHNLNS
jgi:hypothetical protein